jgi:hypothetical protein
VKASEREIQSKVRGQPSENLTLMTLETEEKLKRKNKKNFWF